jgi:DKNYY family
LKQSNDKLACAVTTPQREYHDRHSGLKSNENMKTWVGLAKLPKMRRVSSEHPSLVLWEIRDGKIWHQGKQLRSADPDTFEIRADEQTFLARDRSHIYHAWTLQKAVDRATFESLGDRYYQDRNRTYLEYETSLKPLKGQDVKRFVVLGSGYARDSVYGYYWGTPLRKCQSPLSLQIVRGDKRWTAEYARDDDHIYYEGAALKDAD